MVLPNEIFSYQNSSTKIKALEVQRELNTLHIIDRLSDPELKFQKKIYKEQMRCKMSS
jgi:hypothetical protein